MRGKDLKRILTEDGWTIMEIALSLNISDQRIHSLLKSDNIKSGTIELIAEVTNKTVGYYYDRNAGIRVPVEQTNVFSHNVNSNIIDDGVLKMLATQLDEKDKQIKTLLNLLTKLNLDIKNG